MLHRFKKTRNAIPNTTVQSGTQICQIEVWGTLEVYVQSNTGPASITLTEVAYIPRFMTNLVSVSIALSKNCFWDTKNIQLLYDDQHLCKVLRHQGLFLLENNSNSVGVDHTANPVSLRASTAEKWHRTLAHANSEVIEHLQSNVEGISVTSDLSVPKTAQCQTCALSKAHKIISRSPDKEEDSQKPFFRISFDLIEMQRAYNQDKWVSHFTCTKTDFTFVFTHPNKSDILYLIQFVIKMIKTRYDQTVAFFRTDGERTIGWEAKDFLENKGITLETSSPNTPEQNGHAERSGGVLLTKARALRIGAVIPESIWPEIIKTAGHIHNRTPMRKHSWKTPFEKVTGKKPNMSHLRVFGCRAYALRKGLPRTQKLAERAHLGHLVGYDSTNIFRIWIPSQEKVIRTRDVLFNKDKFYNPEDPDLTQLL